MAVLPPLHHKLNRDHNSTVKFVTGKLVHLPICIGESRQKAKKYFILIMGNSSLVIESEIVI